MSKYSYVTVPHMGRGLIAKTNLAREETVIDWLTPLTGITIFDYTQHPNIKERFDNIHMAPPTSTCACWDCTMTDAVLLNGDYYQSIKSKLDKLYAIPLASSAITLEDCGQRMITPEQQRIHRVIEANSFFLYDIMSTHDSMKEYYPNYGKALYYELSIVNNCCIHYNCEVVTSLGYAKLMAIKDIKAGEALTINYSGLQLTPYDSRQEILSDLGFQCRCIDCQAKFSPTLDDTMRTAMGLSKPPDNLSFKELLYYLEQCTADNLKHLFYLEQYRAIGLLYIQIGNFLLIEEDENNKEIIDIKSQLIMHAMTVYDEFKRVKQLVQYNPKWTDELQTGVNKNLGMVLSVLDKCTAQFRVVVKN